MKVLMICNDLAYFRAHRENVAKELVNRGNQVVVASGNYSKVDVSDWRSELTLEPLTIDRHRFSPVGDWRLVQHLRRLIRKSDADLVQAITIKPILYSAIAMRGMETTPPTVWTFPGLGKVFEPSNALMAKARRGLVQSVLRNANRVIKPQATFENRADLRRLATLGIVAKERAHLLPGTGLPTFFKDMQRSKPEPGAPTRVLMATRLLREKGVDTFLYAAKRLAGPNLIFTLAGPIDPSNPDAASLVEIEKADAAGHISFLGELDQASLRKELLRTDIFCLPSRLREGFPRSLMEAAAAECCLVATDMAGVRRLVVDGVTGRLFDKSRPDQLVQILSTFAAGPDRIRMLGQAARRRIDEIGVWDDSVVARMLEVFTSAIEETSHG